MGYHHYRHVGDCDYVEDIDDFDDTVDDHDDPGVTLVSVYGNLSQHVSGWDPEDTITDVDGSDFCNTFTPADDLAVILSSAMTLTFICHLFFLQSSFSQWETHSTQGTTISNWRCGDGSRSYR